MSNQKAVFDLALSAGMLVSGAGMFVAGALGVYRHRPTVAALYLDARVWWSRNLGAGRAKQLAEEASAQAARRAEAVQIEDDGSVSLYSETDPGSGLVVYSWRDAVSGAPLSAVGPAAAANYCPRTLAELGAFEPAPCPFVLLTYVSARGEERTIPVDPRLWYRRRPDVVVAAAGVPKFTADEVHFLLCCGCPENASVWTPEEYTLECTTADGEDLVLSQKQVFWTVPPPPQHHLPPLPAAAATPDETVAMEEEEEEKSTAMEEEEAVLEEEETVLEEEETVLEEEETAEVALEDFADSAAKRGREEEEAVNDSDDGDLMPPPKKLPRGRRDADARMVSARATFARILAGINCYEEQDAPPPPQQEDADDDHAPPVEEEDQEDADHVPVEEVFDDLDFAAVD